MATLDRWTRGSAALVAAAVVAAGCGGDHRAARDTAVARQPATPAPAPAPPPILLADIAGRWQVHAVPLTGDSTPTDFALVATNSTSGWTMDFPGRPPMPVTVTTSGDSLMVDAGPYTGVRSRGVKVTTNSVSRLEGGKLVGTIVAHYVTNGEDSTLVFRTMATREKQ